MVGPNAAAACGCLLVLGLGLFSSIEAIAQPEGGSSLPPITVEDAARFADIGDPGSITYSVEVGSPVLWSPQRDHFAVVTRYGDPETDSNRAEVRIYNGTTLTQGHAPILQTSSRTIYQPLAFLRWIAAGDTLVWAGSDGRDLPQVYRMPVSTGRIERLTSETAPLSYYDITGDGQALLALTANNRTQDCFNAPCRIRDSDLWSLMTDTPNGSSTLALYDLRSQERQVLPPPEQTYPELRQCDVATRSSSMFSPSGRFVARVCELSRLPPDWMAYRGSRHPNSCVACNQVLAIYDRQSHDYRILDNYPFDPFPLSVVRPIWTSDRTLLLLFAREPLRGARGNELRLRQNSFSTVELDVLTGVARRVFRFPTDARVVRSAVWNSQASELAITWSDVGGRLHARTFMRGTRWINADAPTASSSVWPVRITIQQSLTQRPLLVATDETQNSRVLLDPNSWLDTRNLARLEVVEWADADDNQWDGGLYMPIGATRAAPLVIQTHGFRRDRFSLTGYANNFAAQALAAQGIAVLQMNDRFAGNDPSDLPRTMRAYESAIDYLVGRGIADPTRIGIVGWSATGTSVGYLLTHSEYQIAAAAFTGSADFGWLWFTLSGAPDGAEGIYGNLPYGPGLDSWLENAPTFNLERVRTPLLITNGVASPPISSWDWFAGLRRLGRPVDMYWTTEGTHDVYRLGQRIGHNRLLVNWFRFWLKDEETSLPPGQYSTWREFRRQQKVVQAQPRPPLLDWTATPRFAQ